MESLRSKNVGYEPSVVGYTSRCLIRHVPAALLVQVSDWMASSKEAAFHLLPTFYATCFFVHIFGSSVSHGSYSRKRSLALHLERWHNRIYRLPKKMLGIYRTFMSRSITLQGTNKRICSGLCVLCWCSNFFRGFYTWCRFSAKSLQHIHYSNPFL